MVRHDQYPAAPAADAARGVPAPAAPPVPGTGAPAAPSALVPAAPSAPVPGTPGPVTPVPAVPGTPAVAAIGLTKVYGSGQARVTALDGVSLSVPTGQFVAVMGPSGSGKSTLLHCLAGLDAPTSGRVLIAGADLTGMDDRQLTDVRRDQLGFVFQSFNLLPTLTAEENILLPLRLAHRRPQPQWWDAVVSALGIGDRLTHRPTELSGGQQQRVAVARALIGRPAVVFADEPTGALDTASAASLLETLARMCAELGQTVVMVTHDENAAAATSRVIRLRDGHVVGDAPVHHPAGTHAAPGTAPDAPAYPGPLPTRPGTGRASGTGAR